MCASNFHPSQSERSEIFLCVQDGRFRNLSKNGKKKEKMLFNVLINY